MSNLSIIFGEEFVKGESKMKYFIGGLIGGTISALWTVGIAVLGFVVGVGMTETVTNKKVRKNYETNET